MLSKRRSRFVGLRISWRLVVLRGPRRPLTTILFACCSTITGYSGNSEIAFAYIHPRFRTDNDLCSRFRSWRPERQQSLHRRPTALRCRPISRASRRRTAAPPGVSRQSRHARRRVDHHVPRAPYAGGKSSRGPGETGRTDRPRSSRTENPPPKPAHARLQGPSAHGKIATIRLQETARPDERRLSRLILPRKAFLRLSGRPPQMPGSGMRTIGKMSSEDDSWKTPEGVPIGVDGGQRECEVRRRTLPAQLFLRVFRGQCLPPGQSTRRRLRVKLDFDS